MLSFKLQKIFTLRKNNKANKLIDQLAKQYNKVVKELFSKPESVKKASGAN